MNNKLKQARKNKGLTQVEIAEKAKISIVAYQNYEADRRVPNVKTAKMIAKVLNCQIDDLF